MPELRDSSWRELSAEELKVFYEHDPKEYSREETDVIVALVHLVEQEKTRAFMKPDGTIFYQWNDLMGDWTVDACE